MGSLRSNRPGRKAVVLLAVVCVAGDGCSRMTAVNLNDPKQPEGIPYYLPKPYLIVSKNVRYIPTPTVGLTSVVAAPPADAPKDPAAGGTPKKDDASTPKDKAGTGGTGGGTGGGGQQGGSAAGGATAHQTGIASSDDPFRDPGVRRYADALAVQLVAELEDPPANGANGNGAGARRDATSNMPADANAHDTPAPDHPASQDSSGGTATQFFGPAALNVVPSVPLPDGLQPETFYTYQFVYLPDLTQKYGLRIEGGAGEMRQTMNLVNGWMYTGAGPMYLRNSSTAENINATGQAVGAIGDAIAKLVVPTPAAGGGGNKKPGTDPGTQVSALENPSTTLEQLPNFAELYIYAPVIDPRTKVVTWQSVESIHLSRPTLVAAKGPVTNGGPRDTSDAAAENRTIHDTLMGHVVTAAAGSSQGAFRVSDVTVGDQIVVTVKAITGATSTLTDPQIAAQLVEVLAKLDPPITRLPGDFVIKKVP